MEQLQKELEDTRSAMEALAAEHRAKTLLSETLRRAHDDLLSRFHSAKAEIEKLTCEAAAKADEATVTNQMYEDLRSSFSEKESVIKQLSAANEGLKSSFKEESAGWEVRSRKLVSALDEANAERDDQKRTICAYKEEIERLKGLLSLSQKKCDDAESRARAPKELQRRDDMLFELEQEKGRIEEKLKWKSEQFGHLEDAHSKIQDEFCGAKKEWASEKSNLFDEINTLQLNLDSQTRVAEDLRSQLQMCNQALAHEESRRKLLEIKVSESEAKYDNVVTEYEEARLNIEILTTRRDKEIAALRNSLATKATLLKETEFSRTHLELENQELRKSLKEFQEAEINGADTAASLKKLRLKFKSLEQVHRDCSEKLKAREVEWTALSGKLGKELDECSAKLASKDYQILELQLELEESCDSLMQQKLESEVISVVHTGLESELLEYCSDLEKAKTEFEHYHADAEGRISILMERMEKKTNTILHDQTEVKIDYSLVDSSVTRNDYVGSFGQEHFLSQKELASYNGMFEESYRKDDRSRRQGSQKINDLEEELKKTLDALEQANSVIAKKTSELHKVEFELQQLKEQVEQMEILKSELAKCCAESDELRRTMELSFIARADAEKALAEEKGRFLLTEEEKDKTIEELKKKTLDALEQANSVIVKKTNELHKVEFELQQLKEQVEQMEILKSELAKRCAESDELRRKMELSFIARVDAEKALAEEKGRFLLTEEEKDKTIEELKQQLFLLEKDFSRKEFEVATLTKLAMEKDNKRLLEIADDLEKRLNGVSTELEFTEQKYKEAAAEATVNLVHGEALILSLEREFTSTIETTVALKVAEKQSELDTVYGALEQIMTAHFVAVHEIQYKRTVIDEMEEEINKLKKLLLAQEKQSFDLKDNLCRLQAENIMDKLERDGEKDRDQNEIKSMKISNRALEGQIAQLTLEREELVGLMREFSDLIGEVYEKDEALVSNWGRVVKKAVNVDETATLLEEDDFLSYHKVDSRNSVSPSGKTEGQNSGRRSPLKESNC